MTSEDDRRRSSNEIATICTAELTAFGDCR
jgi:hypothetical protein